MCDAPFLNLLSFLLIYSNYLVVYFWFLSSFSSRSCCFSLFKPFTVIIFCSPKAVKVPPLVGMVSQVSAEREREIVMMPVVVKLDMRARLFLDFLSLSLSLSLSINLSIYLSVCLSVYLSIYLSISYSLTHSLTQTLASSPRPSHFDRIFRFRL